MTNKIKNSEFAKRRKYLYKLLEYKDPALNSKMSRGFLSRSDIGELIDTLTYELTRVGLDSDDEPNELGDMIESIIEEFNEIAIKNENSDNVELPIPKSFRTKGGGGN